MTEIINKITSYNLFNYLLPGVLFAALAGYFTSYNLIQDNLIIGAFLYYFFGLIISRFGSLVVERLLRKIKFIKFEDYKKFVVASKTDSKIDTLSETNNIYRNFNAMFILLILLKLYELIETQIFWLKNWSPYILILLLLIMFLYSYRKQTDYIVKRIKANNS